MGEIQEYTCPRILGRDKGDEAWRTSSRGINGGSYRSFSDLHSLSEPGHRIGPHGERETSIITFFHWELLFLRAHS